MFKWWFTVMGMINSHLLSGVQNYKSYVQRYEKTLMSWGSGLFWIYFFQCMFGTFMTLGYCLAFDTGLPGTLYLWWETLYGSFLVSLHSEFGNLVFLFLYLHLMTKLWTSMEPADTDGYSSWMTGSLIFVFTYVAGVTGAMMPCSTLSEVTATITGSAMNSMAYVKFDFLETILMPGMVLNEDSIFSTFLIHAIVPFLGLGMGFFHMMLLHSNKYSGAGGLKSFSTVISFSAAKSWYYSNRYWLSAFGTWMRIFMGLMIISFTADLFWSHAIGVGYAFCNFEYWPVSPDIDFALAMPHWYLSPLMGSLVTMPHHYLGFAYIGAYFILVIMVPWLNEKVDDDIWLLNDNADSEGWFTSSWDTINTIVFLIFFLSAMFTCAMIPTGSYFMAVGSMDSLVFAYWMILFYIFMLNKLGFYTFSTFFTSFAW